MQKIKSSFRDPGSQVFSEEGRIYRLIRAEAVPHYRQFISSGLYEKLVAENLLVPHREVAPVPARFEAGEGDIVIQPERVAFISYPFEWCFSALREAALATLRIQKLCLDHGMTLQDASAYNLQYHAGRWTFIDTGSFRQYAEGDPWGAYRQFCQHFLGPLLLMSYADVRLSSLLAKYLDGVPLDLIRRLLPWRAKARLPVLLHIVMHSRYAVRDFDVPEGRGGLRRVSKNSVYGLIDQLASLIRSLEIRHEKTVWTEYEDTHTYNSDEYRAKEAFISGLKDRIPFRSVWDLGANTGHFSRVVAAAVPEAQVMAFEYDFMTVEAGYRKTQEMQGVVQRPLHLWSDLFNPTPSCGWASEEWAGMIARGPADLVLALALVHHICLAGNVPFDRLFSFLKDIARHVAIEFVPKDDPQSRRLLKTREDIFGGYTQEAFEHAFAAHFDVLDQRAVSQTGRRLYLLKRKGETG